MTIDIDDLIRKERDYHESIEPVDVPVMLGGRILTVRIPYIWGAKFNDLASKYPVERGKRGNRGPWDLDAVMRDHPDVLLIDGGEEDDLFVLRNKSAVYRWPEVYDALGDDDKENLQAVIWGLHVQMPRERLIVEMKARAEKETKGVENV